MSNAFNRLFVKLNLDSEKLSTWKIILVVQIWKAESSVEYFDSESELMKSQ